MLPYKIIVLASGDGSTLQAIIDRIVEQQWPICIVAVVSDNPDAYALNRAQHAQLPTQVLVPKLFIDSQAYHLALQNYIDKQQPDLIVLAGYMRILSATFVQHYVKKIINLHPALLPKFPGLDTYRKALAAGETEHGATVHSVTTKVDAGPIIAQAKVAIAADETPASLQAKVQALERQLYPDTIYAIAQKKILLY